MPHSLRIRYEPSEDTMMIDTSAIRSLELIQNLRSPKSKDSLYGLLNHTHTPMGARLLRNNLIQPSTRKDAFLEPRYEAVSELIDAEDMLFNIRKGKHHFRRCKRVPMLTRQALKAFNDVEGMLSKAGVSWLVSAETNRQPASWSFYPEKPPWRHQSMRSTKSSQSRTSSPPFRIFSRLFHPPAADFSRRSVISADRR